MQKIFQTICLVSLAFALALGCSSRPPIRPEFLQRTQTHMGTFITILLPKNQNHHFKKAFEIFRDLDQKLSHYQSDSEISRINRGEEVVASPSTLEVIEKSKKIHSLTDGHFDITIGALSSKAFIKAQKSKQPINPLEAGAALETRGFDHLAIKKSHIRVLKPGLQIDLGGIGKGFAVDKVAIYLKSQGVRAGQVSASGDIRCFNKCQLFIQDPKDAKKSYGPLQAKVKDLAISTSGNYRNYIVTPSSNHLFSPKTGKSQQLFASVTIVTRGNNTLADALATAIATMSLEKALKTLKDLKVGAFLILNDGRKIRNHEVDLFVDLESELKASFKTM